MRPLDDRPEDELLILAAGLDIGGAEVVIKHLVHAIDRDQFNVTIGCIRAPGIIGNELIQQDSMSRYCPGRLDEGGIPDVPQAPNA